MNTMKKFVTALTVSLLAICSYAQSIIVDQPTKETFALADAVICVDPNDYELIQRTALLLQQDIQMVTGKKLPLSASIPKTPFILIGSSERSSLIKSLEKAGKLNSSSLKNKWEGYLVQSSANSLIITGNNRRGVAYGVFEISRQLGVSPWYWWADVPVKKKENL
jgi:hypothetical protein